MNLRVLLIESEAEEVLFLQEVLREMEEGGWLKEWPRIEPDYVATWGEAERFLHTIQPHAVLLNPNLGDKQGAETFRLIQAAAPDVPVLLLVHSEDEALAAKLIREGAQDFLLKGQVDCAPLAHALRNAVLRHRLLSAARAGSRTDPLTGLTNRAGFLAAAARDRKLAERLDRRWMILVAQPRNLDETALAFGPQRRDLDLVEAAEHLRGIATPADLVARIGDRHFALGVFDTEIETVEEAWARIRNRAAERRIDVGASVWDRNRPLSLDCMIEQAIADMAPLRERYSHTRTTVAGAA